MEDCRNCYKSIMRNGAPLMFLICLYFWSALNVLLPVPVELSGPLKSTLCSSDHFKLSIDKIKLDSSFIFPTKCELKVVIGPKTCGESKDDFIGKGEWCLVSFSLSFSPLLLLISYNCLASSPLPESWETAAPTSLPDWNWFVNPNPASQNSGETDWETGNEVNEWMGWGKVCIGKGSGDC